MACPENNVVDLRQWRAQRRPEDPPSDVLDAIDAASLVYDALVAQGHEVRFDLPAGGDGRVRAELRSVDGDVVRAIPLDEVVGLDEADGPGVA